MSASSDASEPAAAVIWVVCGAGRGVGKTHLARRLCAVLPAATYAKLGCGQRRPDGPPNFFHTSEELDAFVERSRQTHQHVVIESNQHARDGRGDIIIYVDAIPDETDVRTDADALRATAHLQISADASIRQWKRRLRERLTGNALVETVCDCLMEQKRHVLGGRPEVRVKIWLVEGGMHVFGAGLARLLEHVDHRGTLRDAAKAARMSYRHAWGLIRKAEKHHGQPLIIPQPGGAGGGQSTLSEHGRRLLRAYRRIGKEVSAVADKCFAEAMIGPGDAAQWGQGQSSAQAEEQTAPVGQAAERATRAVEPVRISTAGAPPVRYGCEVVIEAPLAITIEDVGSFSLLCTPCEMEALAVGWALSAGFIDDVAEVARLTATPDLPAVIIRLTDPGRARARRDLIAADAGGQPIQPIAGDPFDRIRPVGDALRLSGEALLRVIQELRGAQRIFVRTGGTHAVGIFSPDGSMLAFSEDIGRHNALDKAIGQCALRGQCTRGCGAALSGRVSIELVAKAARAGLELIAAVSAPSSAALEAAERCHITLCAFVRDTRATIYTYPHRVINAAADRPTTP